MHYSPVRHSTPGSKLPSFPFDLHVLSMPPAFNLSQDQTLQFNLLWCFNLSIKSWLDEASHHSKITFCVTLIIDILSRRTSHRRKRPHNLLNHIFLKSYCFRTFRCGTNFAFASLLLCAIKRRVLYVSFLPRQLLISICFLNKSVSKLTAIQPFFTLALLEFFYLQRVVLWLLFDQIKFTVFSLCEKKKPTSRRDGLTY